MMLYDIGGRLEQWQLDIVITSVEYDISADCCAVGVHFSEAEDYVKRNSDKNEIAKNLGLKIITLRRLRKIRGWDR
jgi:hypothetical protein